eukprot:g3165.t1
MNRSTVIAHSQFRSLLPFPQAFEDLSRKKLIERGNATSLLNFIFSLERKAAKKKTKGSDTQLRYVDAEGVALVSVLDSLNLGVYLGSKKTKYPDLAKRIAEHTPLAGVDFVDGMRNYFATRFLIPNKVPAIERLAHVFADTFVAANPKVFGGSKEAAFVMTFSSIMLSIDFHGHRGKRRRIDRSSLLASNRIRHNNSSSTHSSSSRRSGSSRTPSATNKKSSRRTKTKKRPMTLEAFLRILRAARGSERISERTVTAIYENILQRPVHIRGAIINDGGGSPLGTASSSADFDDSASQSTGYSASSTPKQRHAAIRRKYRTVTPGLIKLVDTLTSSDYVRSPAAVDTLLAVDRKFFVPKANRKCAYADQRIAMSDGSSLLRPRVYAVALEALEL